MTYSGHLTFGEAQLTAQEKNTILDALQKAHRMALSVRDDALAIYASTNAQMGGSGSQMGENLPHHASATTIHLEGCINAIEQAISHVRSLPTTSTTPS